MRCLYCGKQLPLLKKLTGGGEFCSEAHRQRYQEEYNKLALSRLLQTQAGDSDAPRRGDLIPAGRQLESGQATGGLRALEAPKGAVSTLPLATAKSPAPASSFSGDSFSGNSKNSDAQSPLERLQEAANPAPPPSPGRTARALPSPALPAPSRPLPPPMNPVNSAGNAMGDFAARVSGDSPDFSKKNTKKDAFSFRPLEPFPVAAAPAPPPPPAEEPVPELAAEPVRASAPEQVEPVVAKAPPVSIPVSNPALTPVAKAAQTPAPEPDAPEASFQLDPVAIQEPGSYRATTPLEWTAFTDGKQLPAESWAALSNDIGSPEDVSPGEAPPGVLRDEGWSPGRIEDAKLIPLPVGEIQEEDELESSKKKEEIKKRVIENQVKPGNFEQTAPTAPKGSQPVLPVREPAPAISKPPIAWPAKAPASQPALYLALAANGEDLWRSTEKQVDRLAISASIRQGLTLVAPPENLISAGIRTSQPATTAAVEAPVLSSAAVPREPVRQIQNTRAAELLKGAAAQLPQQIQQPAPPAVPKPKPSQQAPAVTPKHEVFVDLSMFGIEEEEDADASSLAREGESPPGDSPTAGLPAEALPGTHLQIPKPARLPEAAPYQDAAPELSPRSESIPLKAAAIRSLRLESLRILNQPLRPKIVFEAKTSAEEATVAEIPAILENTPVAEERPIAGPKVVEEKIAPISTPEGPAAPLANSAAVEETPVETPVQRKRPTGARPLSRVMNLDALGHTVRGPEERRLATLNNNAEPQVGMPQTSSSQASAEKSVLESKIPESTLPESTINVAPETAGTAAAAREEAPVQPSGPEAPAVSQALTRQGAAFDWSARRLKAKGSSGRETAAQAEEKSFVAPAAPEERPAIDVTATEVKTEPIAVPEAAVPENAVFEPAVPEPAVFEPAALEPEVVREKPKKPAPAAKQSATTPDSAPAPKKQSVKVKPSKAKSETKPVFEVPSVGQGPKPPRNFWANLPIVPKLAAVFGVATLLGLGAWIQLRPRAIQAGRVIKAEMVTKKASQRSKIGKDLLEGQANMWTPDWGGELNHKLGRTISYFRPSAQSEDYRIDFEGTIAAKGLGFVFRASDPKNYYGYRVEIIHDGDMQELAVVHIAMIDGTESQRHYLKLPKPLKAGTPFRVRLDVDGDEFSFYFNNELAEVWPDPRLARGGVGLMVETGENAQIRKLSIHELTQ